MVLLHYHFHIIHIKNGKFVDGGIGRNKNAYRPIGNKEKGVYVVNIALSGCGNELMDLISKMNIHDNASKVRATVQEKAVNYRRFTS